MQDIQKIHFILKMQRQKSIRILLEDPYDKPEIFKAANDELLDLQNKNPEKLNETFQELQKQHYLNLPDSNADLEAWGRKPSWTINEAAALFVGKDPLKLSYEVAVQNEFLDIVKKFLDFRDSLKRAVKNWQAGELSIKESCPPINFIKWAEHYKVDVPTRLKELVEEFAVPVVDCKDLYKEETKHKRFELSDAELNARLNDINMDQDDVINPKERTSIYLIIGSLLEHCYGKDYTLSGAVGISEIQKDIYDVTNKNLDPNTIKNQVIPAIQILKELKKKKDKS